MADDLQIKREIVLEADAETLGSPQRESENELAGSKPGAAQGLGGPQSASASPPFSGADDPASSSLQKDAAGAGVSLAVLRHPAVQRRRRPERSP